MKKFFNYKTGLFCGGAILGVALVTIVGCGQSNTALLPTTVPGTTGVATVSAATLSEGFQQCMYQGGIQTVSPSGVEGCQQTISQTVNLGTMGSGTQPTIGLVSVYPNDTFSWTASGTWDTGSFFLFGDCSGHYVSNTSEVLLVNSGSYASSSLPINTPTVISVASQLTWEMNTSHTDRCSKGVSVTWKILRCVDVNNNSYQCS
jgi:hypothetical protein